MDAWRILVPLCVLTSAIGCIDAPVADGGACSGAGNCGVEDAGNEGPTDGGTSFLGIVDSRGESCDLGPIGDGVGTGCVVVVANFSDVDETVVVNDIVGLSAGGVTSETALVSFVIGAKAAAGFRFTVAPLAASTTASFSLEYLGVNHPFLISFGRSTSPTAIATAGLGSPGSDWVAVDVGDAVAVFGSGVASTAASTIVSFAWELVETPIESAAELASPFSPISYIEEPNESGLKYPGFYRVRLRVTDSDGLVSANSGEVVIVVVP